jgi:hypothetical protein
VAIAGPLSLFTEVVLHSLEHALSFPHEGTGLRLEVGRGRAHGKAAECLVAGFLAFVQSQTFVPRPDLDLLSVPINVRRGAVMKAWLIPSVA